MKLPFDFGLRFILRLVAPGALLGAVLLPLSRALACLLYPGLGDAVLFVTTGLICGFALLLLDMPIYMAMEGRRFWPGWLRDWGIARQQKRLDKLRALSANANSSKVEYDLLAWQYPLDRKTGEPVARYPTQLGNLLTSFETYPTVKYGLDGVFFWPRLWVTIDKDLREELDSTQAVVDGAIYASAAFVAAAVAALVYTGLGVIKPWGWGLAGVIACIVLARLLYLVAIPRYAQYGRLFAAVFDQHRDKLKQGSLLADLDAKADVAFPPRSEREQWRAVWRFLQWHEYRTSPTATSETVQEW